MSNTITISGNVTADPEVRFTQSGTAVVNFTVADTPRVQDAGGEWKDGETLFQRVSAWDKLAEHIGASIRRGDRVIVVGRIEQKSYTKDDKKVDYTEVRATDVGASLRYTEATIAKNQRQG